MTLVLLIVLVFVPLLPASPAAAAPAVWRWPLDGRPRIVRHFAPPLERWLAGHRGIDLAAPPAAPVLAAGAGTVRYAGRLAGRGVVSVEHPGGLRTTYLPVTPSVRRGEHVSAGDPLGVLEASAESHCAESCLHWGLLRPPHYLDPLLVLGQARVRLLPFWDPAAPGVNVRFPPDAPSGARPETLDMGGEDTHDGLPRATPPRTTTMGPTWPHDTTHTEPSGPAALQALTTTPRANRGSSSPTRTRAAAASQTLITLAHREQRRTTTTKNHKHTDTPTEAHTATHAVTDPVASTATDAETDTGTVVAETAAEVIRSADEVRDSAEDSESAENSVSAEVADGGRVRSAGAGASPFVPEHPRLLFTALDNPLPCTSPHNTPQTPSSASTVWSLRFPHGPAAAPAAAALGTAMFLACILLVVLLRHRKPSRQRKPRQRPARGTHRKPQRARTNSTARR
ncbi:peptidoglycan DD-metalloendopeptidase family protein [Nonomuraea sp. 3-1Str]|uniref:peptidoglycan DD-metalloendopeptidase family protein n=1 Tax=Nonomuraea sp. 3-1Str TaxID=2929801 RepID=UPI002864A2EA|nr:peptidoglycan DD-metalloendopeptidase family protein [Nonomuraea sp. 3-1Str]MDR8410737.1 peptidoglycan DD-metalloendopeptidase family protein [Nonomuraea sp. 3-1Str]